jgi:hypothetical protein
MAYVNFEFVKSAMHKHNAPYWRLKDGKQVMDESDDNNDNVDAQIIELENSIKNIDGNYINVIISKKTRAAKAEGAAAGQNFEYTLKLDEFNKKYKKNIDEDSANEIEINGTDSLMDSLQREHLELVKQNTELKYQNVIQELKNEVKNLREEMNNRNDDDEDEEDVNGLNGLITMAKPYIPLMLNKFFGDVQAPRAMAGVEDVKHEVVEQEVKVETTPSANPALEHQKKLCANACSKLLKLDANAGEKLTMLAEMAELSPEMYKSAAGILQNQLSLLKGN